MSRIVTSTSANTVFRQLSHFKVNLEQAARRLAKLQARKDRSSSRYVKHWKVRVLDVPGTQANFESATRTSDGHS